MAPKNEVAKKAETAIALNEMPEYLKGLQDNQMGNEEVGKDDLVIPRLAVIQAISPELDKSDPSYIPGAEVGMLFNTLTKELMSEIDVVSVMFTKPYLMWRDRKKGGGFGGQYDSVEEADEARSQQETPAEWGITDTPTNLCLAIPKDGGRLYEIAIPLPKSKAKISRQWNSTIRLYGGPRFSRIYRITAVDDKNNAGEKFQNLKIDHLGFAPENIFNAAKELYEMVSSGEVKVTADYSEENSSSTEKTAF